MRMHTYGGLDVRIAGGPDREGGGNGPVVLLLHGFGAPGDDLVALWRMLRVPDDVRFVFPVAPLKLDDGLPDGRAWWMLDMDRIARGLPRDIEAVPDGLAAARERVLAMLDDLDRHEGLPPDRVFLGGFSKAPCWPATRCCAVLANLPGSSSCRETSLRNRNGKTDGPPEKGFPCFKVMERTTPYSHTTRRYNSRTPSWRTGSP